MCIRDSMYIEGNSVKIDSVSNVSWNVIVVQVAVTYPHFEYIKTKQAELSNNFIIFSHKEITKAKYREQNIIKFS